MRRTIYDIDEEILSLLDPETGELLDYEAYESLQIERNRKIENLLLLIKNEEAILEAREDIIRNYRQQITSAKSNIKRMREYAAMVLSGQKFKSPRVSALFRASTAVVFYNETEFIEYALSNNDSLISCGKPEPKKSAIAEALNNGTVIPGAKLESRVNLIIK